MPLLTYDLWGCCTCLGLRTSRQMATSAECQRCANQEDDDDDDA